MKDKVVHVDQFLVLRGRLLRELSRSDLETIRARLEHTLPQAISRLISSTLSLCQRCWSVPLLQNDTEFLLGFGSLEDPSSVK